MPKARFAQLTGRRGVARRGAVAMFAQTINSLSNLMVSIVVARLLGPSALGRFALLFTILLTLVALQTAWVGDSLTVLDRGRSSIRQGIATSQWMHVFMGMLVGGLAARYIGGVNSADAFIFALLVAAWELEEYGRRMFMARFEFWKQAANDGSYLVITAVCLLAWGTLTTMSLSAILCCMTIGALGAFLLGIAWLPAEERLIGPSRTGFFEVSRYGFWRGAQSGSGYLSQVVVRSLVIGLSSAATMGQIEAARLVVSPLTTLVAALSNVTLASFARSAKAKRPVSSLVGVVILGCGAVCLIYGAFVLALPGFLTHLLGGARFSPDMTALIGWLLVALVLAVSTPFSTLAVVLVRSSTVFRIRLIGSAFEISLTVAVLLVALPSLMPTCLSIGAAVSGIMLWRVARAASAANIDHQEDAASAVNLDRGEAPVGEI